MKIVVDLSKRTQKDVIFLFEMFDQKIQNFYLIPIKQKIVMMIVFVV